MEAKVDSLLEELDSLLDSSTNVSQIHQITKIVEQQSPKFVQVGEPEDLDFLIESLSSIPQTKPMKSIAFQQQLTSSSSPLSSSSAANFSNNYKPVKCFTTYLGPSNVPRSIQQSPIECCNQLFCTKCDLQVLQFYNKEWIEAKCNYLFFRNNYPTEKFLETNLQFKLNSCAYCCQCSWISVTTIIDMKKQENLHWFCRGH